MCGTGVYAHLTHSQHRCCCITWVLPRSPFVGAAAATASVVPIATTTEDDVMKKIEVTVDKVIKDRNSKASSFIQFHKCIITPHF